VGAPFFFSREEGGAVYIYTNNRNHCLDCKKPLRLTGKPESRFANFPVTTDMHSCGVSIPSNRSSFKH
jgi:hypothetical protein